MGYGVAQPFYRITRNGQKLDAWFYKSITKISFKETDANGANETLTIEISDPEHQVMDGNYFVEKKTKLTVEMGYIDGNDFGGVFDGRVEEVDNDYPRSGMVVLKIVAHGKTYQMSESEKSKTWKGKTYSDIVKQVFKSYGINCIVDSTAKILPRKKNKKLTNVVQSAMSDLDFVQVCASKCHYVLKIDEVNSKAWFVSDNSRISSSEMITYVDYKEGNEKLKVFKPKFNDYKKGAIVSASNINISKGKTVSSKKTKKKKKKKKKSRMIKRFANKPAEVVSMLRSNENGKTVYEVQSGDTLFGIAKYFYGDGSRYMDIYNMNASIIKNPDLVYMGQMIIIP